MKFNINWIQFQNWKPILAESSVFYLFISFTKFMLWNTTHGHIHVHTQCYLLDHSYKLQRKKRHNEHFQNKQN